MKVTILHPDFGIGGAERLMLDAAIALRNKGHRVHIVTNYFSRDHCFPELLSFEGALEVINFRFPRTLFGKCYALCAFIRICLAALYVCVYHRDSDVIFSDQISAPLPILRTLTRSSLLFYCHFPDQLLTKRDSFWKSAYRALIDRIEAWTMLYAHNILVNSSFTREVVRQTFPSLANRPLCVLHPPLNCDSINNTLSDTEHMEIRKDLNIKSDIEASLVDRIEMKEYIVFLSINRFEAKKNIQLAIIAFERFLELIDGEDREDKVERCYLVLAGGYDKLNTENISYLRDLEQLIKHKGLGERIKIVKSPSDLTKQWLLQHSNMCVYTPDREHFGIVPLEAMFWRCPVLAVNSGGPMETVVDGETGFLREPEPEEFAAVMGRVWETELMRKMGEKGHGRVTKLFSFSAFSNKLDQIIGSQKRVQ